MSFLTALLPFGGVIEKVFDRVIPDPNLRAQAEMELLKLHQAGEFRHLEHQERTDAGQVAVNVEEAKSDSLFKSGWRPAVGWICAIALSAQFFGLPLLTWVAANTLGWEPPPALETEQLITLLFGMLGLGGYRTFEKFKRVN